jgi:hypothetical protein
LVETECVGCSLTKFLFEEETLSETGKCKFIQGKMRCSDIFGVNRGKWCVDWGKISTTPVENPVEISGLDVTNL